VLLPVQTAAAWGLDGHRVTALLADRILQQSDPEARAKVLALLATDQNNRLTKTDIASEATWADVLRDKSPEARIATTAWHSVRLKPDDPDLTAACFERKPLPAGYPASRGPQDNCIVDKITQFVAELKDPKTSPYQRLAALQFLLNLVGDLHAPLNAIDYGDQGGDCIALRIGSKPPVRLSSYWEEMLVRQAMGPRPAVGAARLAAAIAEPEARQWETGHPESWALETYEIAKTLTYSFAAEQPAGTHRFPARRGQKEPCGSAIPLYQAAPDYEEKALAAVRLQLTRGGVRLAAVLRDSFQ
jgi:hypothetical protein